MKILFILFFALQVICANNLYSDSFEILPIMHQGRVQPLYSYAKKSEEQQNFFLLNTDFLHNQWRKSFTEKELESYKMLPQKNRTAHWKSIHLLMTGGEKNHSQQHLQTINNFTPFSDEAFVKIDDKYKQLYKATVGAKNTDDDSYTKKLNDFTETYLQAYVELAGTVMLRAEGKALYYPTLLQLKGEVLHDKYPFIAILIVLYLVSTLFSITAHSYQKPLIEYALKVFFLGALCTLTFYIALRCYILQRPPVTNMMETLLFVPWSACVCAVVLRLLGKQGAILLAASLLSFICIAMIPISGIDSGLQNVQAVLNSNFWLSIHVLMVVASYGLFIISGILGHLYLLAQAKGRQADRLKMLLWYIKTSMFAGITLLIPGTILGGIWAAQSWGRFWDWDPKESWAFISACVYLICLHLYHFGRISHRGLAYGSVIGLQAIIFTWYGVNYVLGTGLHSYGFGAGGVIYFASYMVLENIFLLMMWVSLQRKSIL